MERDKGIVMKKLEGSVALVTGAASGIGRAIAELFAENGAEVVLVDIDERGLQAAAAGIQATGGRAFSIRCDVTDPEQARAAVRKTVDKFGKLEILVNNAGVSPLRPLEEITLEEWNQVLAINLTGPFLFSQAAFGHLQAAGRRARIINIGSLSGQIGGIAVGAHYTASKGGSMALTRQLARLLAPTRGTANNIAPGTADTALTQAWPEETRASLVKNIPLGRLGQPGEIARLALYLASEEAEFITGATISINGGQFIGG